MKNINFLVSVFCLITVMVNAQGEASKWYFGQNAGLDFSSGDPIALIDGQLNTTEGCATISDSNGLLLFYTDGITVWDKNHNQMPNGFGLLGDPSSTQSGIIVPKPDDSNIYYIFTVDDVAGINGLRYSEVDLTLNNGNGDINASKNIELMSPSTEKISAVQHSNGSDFWVLAHEWNTNNFLAYQVTATGILIDPVVSQVGSIHTGEIATSIGYLKLSPNGERIALTTFGENSIIEIFDFNTSTGTVSNSINIALEDDLLPPGNVYQSYGIEFSPESNVLYVSQLELFGVTVLGGRVNQLDITLNDITAIENSRVVLYSGSNIIGALQLAIDGKIYVSNANKSALDVIENPNELGVTANYQIEALSLNGRFAALGLPPFIQSYFNVGISAVNTCLGDATIFGLNSNQDIISVLWDFGDGTTSVSENPIHSYSSIGLYNVLLTVVTASETTTISKEVTIYDSPMVNAVNDYVLCDELDNNGITVFDLTTMESTIVNGQSNSVFSVLFFESEDNALNREDQLDFNFSNTSNPQTIFARVQNSENVSCFDIISFQLKVNRLPVANVVIDQVFCENEVDGLTEIDLLSINPLVLGNLSDEDFNVTYHISQQDADLGIDALDTNYETIVNPQIIYVRIENASDTSCYATSEFEVIVDSNVVAYQPDDMYVCDDISNDGIATFNLRDQDSQIINSQNVTTIITYHLVEADAYENINEINELFENETNSQQVFARIQNIDNEKCFDVTSFTLNVLETPNIDDDVLFYICTNETLLLSADQGYDYYNWSTGQTTRSIAIESAGTYSVEIVDVYNTNPETQCSRTKVFTVIESNEAIIKDIKINDWTNNSNIITAIVDGIGDYEYSLDNLLYQDSDTFRNLLSGEYTVYVRDKNNCGIISENVFLLHYPKFFTPNGDIDNPYWQINFSFTEPDMEIHIFDRYGKLLTIINPESLGWDGSYNGEVMPTSDYWFMVVRPSNGKTYSGHFTLKR